MNLQEIGLQTSTSLIDSSEQIHLLSNVESLETNSALLNDDMGTWPDRLFSSM
jgi:hypothetical protein